MYNRKSYCVYVWNYEAVELELLLPLCHYERRKMPEKELSQRKYGWAMEPRQSMTVTSLVQLINLWLRMGFIYIYFFTCGILGWVPFCLELEISDSHMILHLHPFYFSLGFHNLFHGLLWSLPTHLPCYNFVHQFCPPHISQNDLHNIQILPPQDLA